MSGNSSCQLSTVLIAGSEICFLKLQPVATAEERMGREPPYLLMVLLLLHGPFSEWGMELELPNRLVRVSREAKT